jgi:hypothetical protein
MHQRGGADRTRELGRLIKYPDAVGICIRNVNTPAIVANEAFLICF